MSGSSPIRSSRISRTRWRSSLAQVALLTLIATDPLIAAQPLKSLATRDSKIVRRWALPGTPHGLVLGRDGTLYVGLAETQEVVAIDLSSGTINRRVVLDSAEIASTKELVTLRTNRDSSRLYVANGSDESVTILSLPEMTVLREITLEGEPVRDALPDPRGRHLYLLGRRVRVYDANGQKELKTLPLEDPMAIAVSSNGSMLAVLGTEDFGNTRATVVALYDAATLTEIARDPLQTDKRVESAFFAAGDRTIVALSREYLFEKHIDRRPAQAPTAGSSNGGPMRFSLAFGDLVNRDRICLPDKSGPQIALVTAADLVLFAEKRCSSSATFSGSARRITPASLYGINAYAVAYDRATNTMITTDEAGYLTIYKVPRAALAK